MDAAEQARRRDRTSGLFARRGFPPERVSRAILAAVRDDRAVVPVTVEAHVARALAGLSRR